MNTRQENDAWLALDIGGANLKAAHSSGGAIGLPFELWKRPDGLPDALRTLARPFPGADGIAVTEIAPGVDLERDILAQSEFPLLVPQPPKLMDAALFDEALIGLELPARAA